MSQTAANTSPTSYAEQAAYLARLPIFISSIRRPPRGDVVVRALPEGDMAGDLPVAIIDSGLRERLDCVEVREGTIAVGPAPTGAIFEVMEQVKAGAISFLDALARLSASGRTLPGRRMVIEITDAIEVEPRRDDVFASEIF